MPRNVYSEINLHLTWLTKNNTAVLVDTVESRAHHYLRHRALQTPGVIVDEIGGTADHVHLAVSIPPTVVITDWIGESKGATSHHINHEICNRKVLAWQDGYGVVSFGTRDLPWVISYIRNQKQHHAAGQTQDRRERTDRPQPASRRSDCRDEPRRGNQKPVETGSHSEEAVWAPGNQP